MNLYEIDQGILDCIDLESGEIIDPVKLSDLQIERNKKIESVALWIKNLNADMTAYKAEKDVFAEREKQAKNKIESLKKWLAEALHGDKFSTSKVDVSFRKSETVEIQDFNAIPEDYKRVKTTVEPDKIAIKDAIKNSHVPIPGCSLVEKHNIQIK